MTGPAEGALARERNQALRHLGAATGVILAMAASSYLVPSLARFRPWVPGERVPLTHMSERFDAVPASAGAGGGYHAASSSAQTEEVLGAEVAAALAEDREGQARQPPPPPVEQDERGERRVRIDPSEYEGIRIHIEDPTGRGMRPFYEALRRAALGEPGALARAAHYGDSTIATDHLTHTVRHRLQRRFGDGGHGFILISKGFMPYRHQDVFHSANEGWSIKEVTRAAIDNGYYGFGGVQIQARAGGVARFGTHEEDEPETGRSLSRFQLLFQRQRGGGDVRLTVDDGEPVVVSTGLTADEEAAGVSGPLDAEHTIDVTDGPHQMEVRYVGGGRVSLYGVVMEREGPGVVYDSLGLVGARASRMLNFDAAHLHAQLAARGTNLLVLGFGGNDSSDSTTEDRYYESFKEVIQHVRGGRDDLGCLIFAPLDQAERDERGNIRTMPMVPRIVAAQRRAAFDLGCAFYDTWEAMGGSGAMQRWSRARPSLAFTDYRHATPEGYRVIADLYYKALLAGFADYLATRPADAPPAAGAPSAADAPPAASAPSADTPSAADVPPATPPAAQ
ncbi:MAG: GDSL-type esterase/lipase family protein [Polyangiales bacterium]